MRFLVRFTMPLERCNQLAREGKLGETAGAVLEEIKPEAVYFTAQDGTRGGHMVVHMNDASEMPISVDSPSSFLKPSSATLAYRVALDQAQAHVEEPEPVEALFDKRVNGDRLALFVKQHRIALDLR